MEKFCKTVVRNMSELLVIHTYKYSLGGNYRLNKNNRPSSERKVFCGRLFATLQACHRKPGAFASVKVNKVLEESLLIMVV